MLTDVVFTLEDEITIGVAVSVVIIGIISLAACIHYVDRRRKALVTAKDKTSPRPEETQPYLQPKAELESGMDRQELAAREARFEVEGQQAMSELFTDGSPQRPSRTSGTHELRGEEHSRELEVP